MSGLSGRGHVSWDDVASVLRRLPSGLRAALDSEACVLARAYGMKFYSRFAQARWIRVAPVPWVVTGAQKRAMTALYVAAEEATRRVYPFWRDQPWVRELLPLGEEEARWVREALGEGTPPPQTYYGRVDAAIDLWSDRWRESTRLIETNMVGIGAVYYAFAANRIANELHLPLLDGAPGVGRLAPEDDILDVLISKIVRHGRAVGLRRMNIAFVEERANLRGPCEFPAMAEIYRSRGFNVSVADPSELRIRRGEIMLGDLPIDLLYRDPTLEDLLEMRDEGTDLGPIREAFRRNRVVSCISGEFDHKGMLELFSDDRFLRALPAAHARLLRSRTVWTRVIRETKTGSPDGRVVDLLPWVARNRPRLIQKPNRGYGGHGMVIGRGTSQVDWERSLRAALRSPGSLVVQEAVPIPATRYPVMSGRSNASDTRFNVCGFASDGTRSALLARFAGGRIVNISRDGGVAGVLVAR